MSLPAHFWRDMPARAFGETGDWIAVLPIAAIEQHGPHLPVGVDSFIAEAMVARVVALLAADDAPPPATFLPVQQVCKSDEHLAYRGTLTVGWETAIRSWLEIGASVARAGVRKLVIVTSHGGNVAPMGVVARELRIAHDLLCVTCAWGSGVGTADLLPAGEGAYGIHGGAAETGMMLAIRPDLVDMARAEDFRTLELENADRFERLRAHGAVATGWMAQDLHPAGTAGDARAGSAAMGEALMARYAAAFLALLRDVAAADPAGQLRPAPPGSLP
ncbi:MAG: creatininase family protein [Pseudomonadota bacterium]